MALKNYWIGYLLVCVVCLSAFAQSQAQSYQAATIVKVEQLPDAGSAGGRDAPLKSAVHDYNVSIQVGDLASLNGVGAASGGSTSQSAGAIQHVVVIFQENRTPDNLFHDQVLIKRGADIASSGKTSKGKTVWLQPAPLADAWDMGHSHHNFLTSWHKGAMDGFSRDNISCLTGHPHCAPSNPEYYYVQPSDVRPYFTLAETYTFGDRMFQTNQGPSFPAHQYIISGTSAIAEKSIFDAAGLPHHGNGLAGCIAPPGTYVSIIDTTNPDPHTNETRTAYPCFEHATLTDLLDADQLSWKYYTPSAGSIWTGPDAINHMCGPNVAPPNATACTAPEWTDHVVIEGQENQILSDIAAGQLATVSWVIPNGDASDHPGGGYKGTGPSWVASIVNAIGTSQYWKDTAIIITWDDWGGWYDHVPPPKIFNSYEYGFRVPLIVVSPYARAAYISHVNHDFGSILKFIETMFGLTTVGPGDGYADSRADDLSDCFNFNQTPLQFHTIAAPLKAEYFQNDKTPVKDPDDD
jgi:phospholipase C